MSDKRASLRGTLYRLYELPAPIHEEDLYQEMLRQRNSNTEKIITASKIRDTRQKMLYAIAEQAGRSFVTVADKQKRPYRNRIGLVTGAAAAAVLAILILQPFRSFSPDTLRVVRWSGNPVIRSASGPITLKEGHPIGEKSTIATKSSDTITLSSHGNTVFIGGNSLLHINRLETGHTTNAELQLAQGGAAFLLDKKKYDRFVVTTPLGRIRVTGTEFSVTYRDARLRVAVRKGRVLFTRSGSVHGLTANKGLTAKREGSIRIVDIRTNTDFKPLRLLLDRINPPRKKPSSIPLPPLQKNTVRKKQPTTPASIISRLVRVHLVSGSIVRGTILKTDRQTIRVRTSYSTMNIKRSSIKKIEIITKQ